MPVEYGNTPPPEGMDSETQFPTAGTSSPSEGQAIHPEVTTPSDSPEISLSGSTLPVVLNRRPRVSLVRGKPPAYTSYDSDVYDAMYDPDADAESGYTPESWLNDPEPTGKHSK